jgi:ABC-type dipeptide/oligopeptide/nickel transport system permease component
MLRHIGTRLIQLIPTLLAISILIFGMLRLIPGDPAAIIAGAEATPEKVAEIRKDLGLDQPIYVQYAIYLGNLLSGDLGRSLRSRNPVLVEIIPRLNATAILTCAAMVLTVAVGLLLGIWSVVKRGRLVDQVILVASLAGVSAPAFWLGLMLMMYLGFSANHLPVAGYGTPAHLVLPAVTVAIGGIPMIARLVRSSLSEALEEEYVRTARAKGVSEVGVLTGHALRNALIPVITVTALEFGRLLSGVVVVESVFAWPGLGRLLLDAIQARDFPVIQGAVLVFTLAFVLVNLIADLLYAWADPRIRYGR